MYKLLCLLGLSTFIAGCKTLSEFTCSNNPQTKFGTALNPTRLKFGAPIIHKYMCFESITQEMENWETPIDFQKSCKKGFHAGKGIFLKSDADLDEKDIYRHRINDSTFEMLGILTEIRKGEVSFPNIWYFTVDVRYIFPENISIVPSRISNEIKHLNIGQADSILSVWGTSRK